MATPTTRADRRARWYYEPGDGPACPHCGTTTTVRHNWSGYAPCKMRRSCGDRRWTQMEPELNAAEEECRRARLRFDDVAWIDAWKPAIYRTGQERNQRDR